MYQLENELTESDIEEKSPLTTQTPETQEIEKNDSPETTQSDVQYEVTVRGFKISLKFQNKLK